MLVIPGDTPLITGDVLKTLVREHESSAAVATVLTMRLADPSGYGRIVRFPDGSVARIVEHRDANESQLAIQEVNSGMYVLPAPLTFDILHTVGDDNDQGEIYLTDVVAGLRQEGERVSASLVEDPALLLGVNSPLELAQAEALMGERIKSGWMVAGTTIIDPGSTVVGADVTLDSEVVLRPFSTLSGSTSVAAGSDIGPGTTIIDAQIGKNCVLPHCYVRATVLEDGTRLRPFTVVDGSPEES